MTVKHYTKIAAFLEDNLSFLEQEEAANNLSIGISLDLQKVENLDPNKVLLIAVFEDEIPVLTVFQTPPRDLIIAALASKQSEAIELLVPFLIKQNVQVPGVIARKSLATDFAKAWTATTNKPWKVKFNQLVYQLDELEKINYPKGQLRLAKMEEVALMSRWLADFLEEALDQKDEEAAKKMAIKFIEAKQLYVWEDEKAVSIVATHRPTRHGITISYVYTPPESRSKGYASAVVAQASALMLKQYDFCSLFTDLANPTSNKIYAKMGYRPIQKVRNIVFLEE